MVKQLDRILDSHLIGERPVQLTPASKLKRFLNLVLDYIGIIFFLAFSFFVIALAGGEEILHIKNNPMGELLVRIQGIICMFLYYVICEFFFKGKTFGKMITKTKVVTLKGQEPTLKMLAGRSLARFIPFEPFSFFGSNPGGWHDRLSKTIVVEDY